MTASGTYGGTQKKSGGVELGGSLQGEGATILSAPPAEVWRRLLDPEVLAAVIPGCRNMERTGPDAFEVEVSIGVAGIRGVYSAKVRIGDQHPPHSMRMDFRVKGRLGNGHGSALVDLAAEGTGTKLAYRYGADVGGTVAAVGARMLGSVTDVLIGQFFKAFERYGNAGRAGLWNKVSSWLGGGGKP